MAIEPGSILLFCPSPPRCYPSSQERRPWRFCAFPSRQMSNKRPKRSFRLSPPPPPLALGRNTSAQGQAPGENSSGRAIPSPPPFPFSVLTGQGTGRSHYNPSRGALFLINAHFQHPNSEKPPTQDKTLSTHLSIVLNTDRHQLRFNDCLNQGLKSKKGRGS